MKKLRIAQLMMVATILLLVAFQSYYITKIYSDEWKDLEKETDVLFRETVYKLQVSRFKKDTLFFRKFPNDNLFGLEAVNVIRRKLDERHGGGKGIKKESVIINLPDKDEFLEREKDEFLSASSRRLLDSIALAGGASDQKKMRVKIFKDTIAAEDSGDVTQIESIVQLKQPGRKEGPGFKKRRTDVTGKNPGNTPDSNVADIHNAASERIMAGQVTPSKPGQADTQTAVKIITRNKVLNDSLPVEWIDSLYNKELTKAGIRVGYTIKQGSSDTKEKAKPLDNELKTSPASVGIIKPYYYQATFTDPFSFIVGRIAPQIILSILLIAFTVVSFVVLYNNLISQRRLANIKNDFISNITHELKTPIATVNVAIEAMRNFNVIQDPARTTEYLDISALELQRLSLLVDKVLRLSMFEKKEIELTKEWFNMEDLVHEVMTSMRLQFGKYKAKVNLTVSGKSSEVHADRLHIMSVIYNLLDNALKYSSSNPIINIHIKDEAGIIYLIVTDNGIGILPRYHEKIFEKFFRVPSNDTHNIKGYGLGLSYACHILQQHNGAIKVESEARKGSRFVIELPRQIEK